MNIKSAMVIPYEIKNPVTIFDLDLDRAKIFGMMVLGTSIAKIEIPYPEELTCNFFTFKSEGVKNVRANALLRMLDEYKEVIESDCIFTINTVGRETVHELPRSFVRTVKKSFPQVNVETVV